MSDCMKMLCENTQRFNGGSAPKGRYYDKIRKHEEKPESAKEIVGRVLKKSGLKIKGVTNK